MAEYSVTLAVLTLGAVTALSLLSGSIRALVERVIGLITGHV